MRMLPTTAIVFGLFAIIAGSASAGHEQPFREYRSGYALQHLPLDAEKSGHRYRVTVMRPSHPPPDGGYPVLFMLDGNAVEQDLGALLPESEKPGESPVIVAIGYETSQRFDTAARAYDYTPALTPNAPETDPLDKTRRNGGADAFLALIEGTILPAVEQVVPVDRRRLGLWGHSYGGLFVLHVLYQAPERFRCLISASPALWWRNGHMVNRWADYRERLVGYRFSVLIARGSAETRPKPPSDDPRALDRWRLSTSIAPEAAREFADNLQSLPNADVRYLEFPGLSHGQAFTASLLPALRWFTRCAATPTDTTRQHDLNVR